jgi:hypothetical protein
VHRDLSWLGRQFRIEGEFVTAVPYGNGHINDTFAASYETPVGRRRYIHQRINDEVFKDPAALMKNVARVTRHIRARLEREGADDIDRKVLTLVPTRDGVDYLVDEHGASWRTYVFIEGATTYDVVDAPARACEVARAFGEFQKQLVDLEAPPLVETIPDFHTTPLRLDAFLAAVEADAAGRAAGAAGEIRRFERFAPLADAVLELVRQGAVPVRVAHNDTKINNVMIDEVTGAALCVIDLDTVMPGLALDDFGDLVRTSVCYAKEDDRDLSKVSVELPLFEGLVQGYVGAVGQLLTEAEAQSLVLAGKLMTLECGLRFLTDHLQGDTYFRVHHEGHNLDRARVQLTLLDSIVSREDAMEDIVANAFAEVARVG